jgi:phage/plasmid-associated DNA primase
MVASYIYLIQDKKYLDQNIFKIGRTTQSGDCRKITRLLSYNKYSNIEFIRQVNNDLIISLETNIINIFNCKFELVEGNEWFKGDKNEMIKLINNIIDNENSFDIEIKNIESDSNFKYSNVSNIDDLKEIIISKIKNIDVLDYMEIIKYIYGYKFVYKVIGDKYKLYCYNGNHWQTDDVIFKKTVSNELYDFLKTIIIDVYWNARDFSQIKSKLDKLKQIGYKKELLETYKEYGVNNDIKFDDKWYLLGFNNMVYDMEAGEIRKYNYEDYISMTTRYDWREPTEDEMNTMTRLIELIMPIPEEREAYLQILSTGLSGKCFEKFIIFNGSGGNGKGMLNDILLLALGDYAMIGNNGILFEASKTGSNPEKANLHKKRLVVFREPPEKNKFENSVVKELTGGGSISARGLYESTCEKELNLTLIVECNKRPLFKEEPTDADARRIIDMFFRSSFVSDDSQLDSSNYIYKANTLYKTKSFQEQHKFALLKILMNTYKKYKHNNGNITFPTSIVERSARYLELSCNIVQWFRDNYEETRNNEYVSIKDVYELFMSSNFINSLSRSERCKYTKKYFVEYIQNNIFFRKYYSERYDNIRSVIKGWKQKIYNDL